MKIWVNDDRTVMVRQWDALELPSLEVSTRSTSDDIWSQPITVKPEQ
jgi:hypothetical protein